MTESRETPAAGIPQGIFFNLGSMLVLTCSYDLTMYKPREGFTLIPPFDARLGG